MRIWNLEHWGNLSAVIQLDWRARIWMRNSMIIPCFPPPEDYLLQTDAQLIRKSGVTNLNAYTAREVP